jgi:nucleoside-diphosphate-sugar epimerase
MTEPYRVIQWGTGNTGAHSLRFLLGDPSFDVVGVCVAREQNVGRDAGELAGLGPVGLRATADVDALVGLDADCVVYMCAEPKRSLTKPGTDGWRNIDEICRLLASGKNVVSTGISGLTNPTNYGPDVYERLRVAAQTGSSTFFATGIEPGFMCDAFALSLSSVSRDVTSIRTQEIISYATYDQPNYHVSQGGIWGAPPDGAFADSFGGLVLAAGMGAPVQILADALHLERAAFVRHTDGLHRRGNHRRIPLRGSRHVPRRGDHRGRACDPNRFRGRAALAEPRPGRLSRAAAGHTVVHRRGDVRRGRSERRRVYRHRRPRRQLDTRGVQRAAGCVLVLGSSDDHRGRLGVLSDRKILVTGATGQIGRPIAEKLAHDNEVWCAARFRDAPSKAELESLGIRTCPWTMGSGDFSMLPTDFTHVVHSAFLMTAAEHDEAVRVNAEGTGMLMQHCRNAAAFLFVSAFAIYARQEPEHEYVETDPLGGAASYSTSYPVAKIATEGTVRAAAQMLGLPTTIARMNIGFGTAGHGGLPIIFFNQIVKGRPVAVPYGHDNWGSPISEQDIAEQASGPLFDIASVPATILNWAGDDAVSHRQMCEYLGGLAGITPQFVESAVTFDSFVSENTRRRQLIGKCATPWRDGMRRAIETRFPGTVTAT